MQPRWTKRQCWSVAVAAVSSRASAVPSLAPALGFELAAWLAARAVAETMTASCPAAAVWSSHHGDRPAAATLGTTTRRWSGRGVVLVHADAARVTNQTRTDANRRDTQRERQRDRRTLSKPRGPRRTREDSKDARSTAVDTRAPFEAVPPFLPTSISITARHSPQKEQRRKGCA